MRTKIARPTVAGVIDELRTQSGPAATIALRGIKEALPVLVVKAVAGQLVGAYGVFDRVLRQAFIALTPVSTTLQGWVPRRMAVDNSARSAVAAMLVGLIFASIIVPLFTLLGAPLITWLSAGTLRPSAMETALCGSAIATSMLILLIGHACLVPLGSIRGIIYGNCAGIVSTLIALPVALKIDSSVASALTAVVLANVVQLGVLAGIMGRRIVIGRRSTGRHVCDSAAGATPQ